jgi:streptogramin lyase
MDVDADGNVYVADQGNSRIQKFTPDGTFVLKWGTSGTGIGQFTSNLVDVAVSESGAVYVLDHRVQKFDVNGNHILEWGGPGTDVGRFGFPPGPQGLGIAPNGHVYVADTGNHRIQVFDTDGTFISTFGQHSDADGDFGFPTDVAVSPSGDIYVLDTDRGRVQRFAPDHSFVLKWVATFGGTAIDVDSSGNVFVVRNIIERVTKSDANGVSLTSWGGHGEEDGQFVYPKGVAVNAAGQVYVSDDRRIQKFGWPAVSVQPMPWTAVKDRYRGR